MRVAKLALLMLTIPLASLAATDYLKKDASFIKARAQLIKDKWLPIRMHINDNWVYENAEKDLVKHNIFEVDSCSMDTARCILYYKKDSHCLRLDTVGEKVKYMKIVQWSDECPASGQEPSLKDSAPK